VRHLGAIVGLAWERRLALTVLLGGMLWLCASGVAFGGVPGWWISSEANPTTIRPGGEALLIVHVANIGSAATNGSEVVVTDTLPAGMEVLEAGDLYDAQGEINTETAKITACVLAPVAEGKKTGRYDDSSCTTEDPAGEGEYERDAVPPRWLCKGHTLVTCESNPATQRVIEPGDGFKETDVLERALEAPTIGIRVKVSGEASGTEDNLVEIAGGGVPSPALARQSVTVTSGEPTFGLSNVSVTSYREDGSTDVEAGAHPYALTFNLQFGSFLSSKGNVSSVGDAKNIEVQAPAGLVGDPQAVAKCTREEFDGAGNNGEFPECPLDSQVGTVVVALGNQGEPTPEYTVLPVFNLVPPTGVPAQFGFSELGIYGTLDASLRTGGDYGITESVRNTAQRSLLGSTLTLWGVPADPAHDRERKTEGVACAEAKSCSSGLPERPFLSNPSECDESLNWALSLDDWLEPGSFVQQSTTTVDNLEQPTAVTACERQEFTGSVNVQPDEAVAESPSGLHVDVHVPQHYENPETPAEATVKDVSVRLPAGLTVSPSGAGGLQACSEAQIGLHDGAAPTCPPASELGTVEVDTPLLAEPLHGGVYLAEQNNNPFGSLLAIYIVAEGSGALVKLAGHVEADPVTGQLTTTVTEAPDLPFEDVKLDFFDGPRAALMTPSGCGSYSSESALSPWNDTAPVPSTSSFAVASGCAEAFVPHLEAGSTSTTAGAFASFTTTVSRQDGEQRLGGVSVTLPRGELGVIRDVARCPEPAAMAGACPSASEIGETTVAAGPGPDPYWLKGRVYLTGPYEGAPFGLSIVVPAIAGPFNLGNVVVRARVSVDPHTAQVMVTTDALPQMVNATGIPTDVKVVNVTVNRPGFMTNPTSCQPLATAATVTSAQGATAGLSSFFQAANCARLAFKPSFKVSTAGKTSKADGASLHVTLSFSGAGQANVAKVHVELPKALPSRLSTLQQACPEATFAADPAACPAASVVGFAKAHTPILGVPLEGPAYFVSHAAAKFPELIAVLQGEGVTIDLAGETHISKAGVTSSTFSSVPDAPVTNFELTLSEGPHSALTVETPGVTKLCKATMTVKEKKRVTVHRDGRTLHTTKTVKKTVKKTLAMPTVITGQNGTTVKQTTDIAVTGCTTPKHSTKKKRHKD